MIGGVDRQLFGSALSAASQTHIKLFSRIQQGRAKLRAMNEPPVPDAVIESQILYYQARAVEYDEWFYRKGRYDYGEASNARWFAEAEEPIEALARMPQSAEVLEFAPGTGIWTERLAGMAAHVTAVDSSAEMLAINRAKLGALAEKVTYVEADIFQWQPDRLYDMVFFGFWLSHVPVERVRDFFDKVASALRPGGSLFFVDGRPEPTVTAADQQHPENGSQIMTRKLNDGRTFQVVKNFYATDDMERRFSDSGLRVEVRETATFFVYGFGAKVSG